MKVAILGCGSMGRSVLRDIIGHKDLSGIVAMDPAAGPRQKARALGDVDVVDNPEAIWTDPDIGLVFITSPNHTHAELAISAFQHGKAVMLEKPIAETFAKAEDVVAASVRYKAFLQVGYELRYSRLYELGKEVIAAGSIGKVVNLHCNYICSEFHHKGSWRNVYSTGGGMFAEKLCHYVDLPRWWTGSEIEEIHSVCASNVVPYYEVRDNYHCVYRMRDGTVGHLTFMMGMASTFEGDPLLNMVDQQMDDGHELRYLVVGTAGAIEMDVFRRRFRQWEFGDSEKCLTSRLVRNETWDAKEDNYYFHDTASQALDVIDRVLKGMPPKITPSDALETMRVVEAADHSAQLGRAVQMSELTGLGDFSPKESSRS